MENLVLELLPELLRTTLPGIDPGSQIVIPDYHGRSISNLPASVCQWLGIELSGEPLAAQYARAAEGTFRHVILVLVDGLSLKYFQRFLNGQNPFEDQFGAVQVWEEILQDASLAPLTSVVPSTTTAALTSLWTGKTPAEHGVVGYELWLKEYGMLTNMILHSPTAFHGESGSLMRAGFKPEEFLPCQTFGHHLSANGVVAQAFLPSSIAHSSLTRTHTAGAQVIPYQTLGDLWVSLQQLLGKSQRQVTYSYIYWGDLDLLSHLYGPDDERLWLEFASFTRFLAQFIRRLRDDSHGKTLVLFTADHGMRNSPRIEKYELKKHPEFMDCLVMNPSGESRLAYLFLKPGKEERMKKYIDQTWPGEFRLFPSSLLQSTGLLGMGEPHPFLPDRLGDWTAVAQGDAYWWWANRENHLKARHGGLSADEMIVPLVIFKT